MRTRSTVAASLAVASFASLAAFLAACVSDDNASPPVGDSGIPPLVDSGNPSFDATLPGADASSPDASGGGDSSNPTGDDSGNPSGGDSGNPLTDGGALVCAPSVRIDLDAGIEPAQAIGSVANGSLRAALWVSYYVAESDQHAHIRGRVFAGADAGSIDLGPAGENANLGFLTDQSNHAFAQWVAEDGGGQRSVFDFTGFSAPTPFSTDYNQSNSMGFAPLPSGALSLYPNPTDSVFYVDKSSGTSAWATSDLDAAAGSAAVRTPALVTNAAGQAIAEWGQSGSGGGTSSFTYNLATYNGTTWSAPVLETIVSDGGAEGAPYNVGVVILASGDAKLVFFYNDHITAQGFSASTHQLVGTPEQVLAPGSQLYFASPTPNAQDWLTIDANDQITLVVPIFTSGAETDIFATRYTGGTWSPAVDIGTGNGPRMHTALSASGAVAVVAENGSGAWVSAVGPTGNAWSPRASFNSSRGVNDLGGITFDATHVYILDSQVVLPQSSALGLFLEVCDL